MPIRRTDRLRRVVTLTCRAIIRGYETDAILSECCRYLVDEGGYKVAWAGQSSDDNPDRIVPKAHAMLTLAMDGVDRHATATETLLQTTALRCVQKRSPLVVRPSEPNPHLGDPTPHHATEALPTVCAVPLELGPHGQGALALGIDDPDAFKAEEVALLRDLANDLGQGISMMLDRAIAEQREDQLHKDREFHASLFNHTPEGAFVATTGGRVVQANPAFARLVGYPDAQSLLGDSSASLYTLIASREKNRLMAPLEDDAAPRTHDVMLRRKDSSSVPVRITVHPIHGPQGRFLQAFVHDLSEAKDEQSTGAESAAKEEAVQTPAIKEDANEAIEEQAPTNILAANTAPPTPAPERTHDTATEALEAMRCALKNAVTPILNHAEMLAQQTDKQDAKHKSVMAINRNASHAANLLHAMDAAMASTPQTDGAPTPAPQGASALRTAKSGDPLAAGNVASGGDSLQPPSPDGSRPAAPDAAPTQPATPTEQTAPSDSAALQ